MSTATASTAAAPHEGGLTPQFSGDHSLAALLRRQALPVLQACGSVAAAVVVVQGERDAVLALGEEQLGSGRPVTRDSVFSVASLAKAFVALAVARLADTGHCSLDEPLRRWVPEMRWPTPELDAEVSLRDVLANRTGVGPVWPLDEMLARELPVPEVLRRLQHAPVLGPPRAHWAYLNLGFVAAALAAERIAGAPYHRVLAQQVLEPLHMRRSASWPGLAERALVPVAAHAQLLPHGPACVLDGEGYANHQGAGWMYLSPADTVRWIRWWCQCSSRLLGDAALADVVRPQVAVADPALWVAAPGAVDAGYGFGWAHSRWHGEPVLQHSGATVGATAHITVLPQRGLGVAVFLSGGDLYRAALCNALLEPLMGRAPSCDWMALGQQALAQARGASPEAAPDLVDGPESTASSEAPAAKSTQAYQGRYAGASCGPVRIRSDGDAGLSMHFAEAPAWNARLLPQGDDRFAVALCQPNDGLRFMRSRPSGRFVRVDGRVQRFEHPWIETLQRAD